MEITYGTNKAIDKEQLKMLYTDVQWTAYTDDLNRLHQALLQSLFVLSAWDGDRLVGLIRVVGDGLTIIYIQDILVSPNKQNQGIATQLMQQTLNQFKEVRQKVLLTEDAPDIRHFYTKNGFQSCDKGDIVAFALLN